jgi:hypothetical protein
MANLDINTDRTNLCSCLHQSAVQNGIITAVNKSYKNMDKFEYL